MPKTVLDVGCGNGINLPLSKVLPVEYHGLDYAEKSIAAARKQYPDVKFHLQDAFNMEFQANSFDMVILSSVLILYKEAKDRENLIQECLRVLKSDGILILKVWNAAPMLYASIKISRFLGKLLGENLPKDFNGIHFKKSEIVSLAKKANVI